MSKKRSSLLFKLAAAVPISLLLCGNAMAVLSPTEDDYALKLLGKNVFFDKISEPERMACVTCHVPTTGGTGGNSGVNLHQVSITGANPHTVGNLKPPTNMYSSFIPQFHPCADGGLLGRQNYCGGVFWSSRTEGYIHPEDAWYPHDCPTPDGPAGSPIVAAFDCLGPIKTFPQPQPGLDRDPDHVATKHIGYEVFQGLWDPPYEYAAYFGPTADQALNPMPNVVEQNKQRQDVCLQVQSSAYAPLYEEAWGEPIDCTDNPAWVSASDVDAGNLPEKKFDISFKRIILAVCAWQASTDLNTFSSKRDNALRAELACLDPWGEFAAYYDHTVCTDEDYINSPGKFPLVGFTCQENYGHDLFYARARNPFNPNAAPNVPADRNGDCVPDVVLDEWGNPVLDEWENEIPVFSFGAGCAFCHSNLGPVPAPVNDGTLPEELYTHQDFHNILVPFNPEIPVLCPDPEECDPFLQPPPDQGLASHLVEDYYGIIPAGFFKTPTLRNVDLRKDKDFIKAYTRNGFFKSLWSIVHFYNTAAVLPPCPLVDDPSYEDNPFFGGDSDGHRPMIEREALDNDCWPAPQFSGGPSAVPFLLGNLGLEEEDEKAVVAYLKTLTDLNPPVAPLPYKGLDDVRVREDDDGGKKSGKKK